MPLKTRKRHYRKKLSLRKRNSKKQQRKSRKGRKHKKGGAPSHKISPANLGCPNEAYTCKNKNPFL